MPVYEDIYVSSDGDLTVMLDNSDTKFPIGFKAVDDGWCTREDAIDAAEAILDACDANKPPANAVRASEVSFNEGLIRLAAVHGKTVTFRYSKTLTSPIETRSFVPGNVRSVEDHVTFTGYDPDRGGVRAFRSDRMVGEVTVL